jgi:DNA-directed RNA polymerase subunit omega
MILYPMHELMANMTSRYELVNVVAHRAREVASDADREHQPLEEKPVTIALNEAQAGLLVPERPAPAETAAEDEVATEAVESQDTEAVEPQETEE